MTVRHMKVGHWYDVQGMGVAQCLQIACPYPGVSTQVLLRFRWGDRWLACKYVDTDLGPDAPSGFPAAAASSGAADTGSTPSNAPARRSKTGNLRPT